MLNTCSITCNILKDDFAFFLLWVDYLTLTTRANITSKIQQIYLKKLMTKFGITAENAFKQVQTCLVLVE